MLLYGSICLISCEINSWSKFTWGYWKLIPSNLKCLLLNFIATNKLISIYYFTVWRKTQKSIFTKHWWILLIFSIGLVPILLSEFNSKVTNHKGLLAFLSSSQWETAPHGSPKKPWICRLITELVAPATCKIITFLFHMDFLKVHK